MWRLSRMMEWAWLQKSRLDWNMKGDRNTRFFHVMATSRKNRNALNSIIVGDRVIEEPIAVKDEVWSHFRKQFSEELRHRPVIGGDFKNVRHSDSFHMLESEFSAEEVWEAIKHYFHERGSLANGLNSSFITLIPKKVNATNLNEYRPISLIGSAYKILTKVLASRLKKGNASYDSLLFCDAECSKVLNLKRILRCFEIASGLKINYHKSMVCGFGISASVLSEFASMLNCKSKSMPLKYLGLPLGACPHRKLSWKPVIEKIKLRLAGWKRRFLFYACRLTLIKGVLSSLPVYYLSLFKIPEGIAKEIEQLQASFLWSGSELKRKVHLVKWEEWRFANEETALWKKVICSKYKVEGGKWLPDPQAASRCSKIWGDILVVAIQRTNLLQFYVTNLQIKVGNGCRVCFWHDCWIGTVSLKELFPRLFRLSNDKDGSFRAYAVKRGNSDNWVFSFRRALFQWEQDELNTFNQSIRVNLLLNLNLHALDKAVWLATKPGQSFVSTLYKQTDLQHDFAWEESCNALSVNSTSGLILQHFRSYFASGIVADLVWICVGLVLLLYCASLLVLDCCFALVAADSAMLDVKLENNDYAAVKRMYYGLFAYCWMWNGLYLFNLSKQEEKVRVTTEF
ncbi:uncharacterized protein LOC114306090 [Camellia sinensis]|uniref:uncharacterized protein LOC114306090 n=1 Tax=Camellia sinensis TaxID=4442 RepID=UPI00103584C4|nr:uncharacterized protein LOC114306090 [Camellia sinensis]